MSSDAPCLCGTLRRLSRAVTAAYEEALAPSELRITQFSILRTLDRIGPATVTRLAIEVALDRSTMGRNLDPLERRGLVQMEVGQKDQRERVVRLTAAGETALAAAVPFWRAAQGTLAQRVPASAVLDLAEQIGATRRS